MHSGSRPVAAQMCSAVLPVDKKTGMRRGGDLRRAASTGVSSWAPSTTSFRTAGQEAGGRRQGAGGRGQEAGRRCRRRGMSE